MHGQAREAAALIPGHSTITLCHESRNHYTTPGSAFLHHGGPAFEWVCAGEGRHLVQGESLRQGHTEGTGPARPGNYPGPNPGAHLFLQGGGQGHVLQPVCALRLQQVEEIPAHGCAARPLQQSRPDDSLPRPDGPGTEAWLHRGRPDGLQFTWLVWQPGTELPVQHSKEPW